ncbi:hypothetical protein [Streptomyces virginiae]|uniref:hypothetical protein n=1 Tax=Streptomyces virginiae TaxID=1961 RepID=UPI0032467136
MSVDLHALHEPLVEWVYDRTTAHSVDHVSITEFGALHGLREEQSHRLLYACSGFGFLDTRYATMGDPAANLTPLGIQWIHERRRRRADPVARAITARRSVLVWLWTQKDQGVDQPIVAGVLETDSSVFEGERLTDDDIDRAASYLLDKGLIKGRQSFGHPGPVRADITTEGQDCVEHYDGDVAVFDRRHDGGSTTFNIGSNTGNIAANSRDFTLNATTTDGGVNLAEVVMLARALRQSAPILGLPDEEVIELTELADRLEHVATGDDVDQRRLHRWGGSVQAILNSPVVTGALGSVLAAYTGVVLPGLP